MSRDPTRAGFYGTTTVLWIRDEKYPGFFRVIKIHFKTVWPYTVIDSL
jgi:hypothetical protein